MFNVIIIIGLPGSGKTTLAKNDEFNEYVLFDDFIGSFINGKVIRTLKDNTKICLTDPRLCDISIFNRYISCIEHYVNRDKIKIILFENNPDLCLNNAKIRGDIDKVKHTIEFYSNIYSLDNYSEWNHIIVQVYKD